MTYFRLTDPDAELVKAARLKAGLSQPEAAEIIGLQSFQRWSEIERGVRPIDPIRWQWFLLMNGLHPKLKLEQGA